MGRSLAVVALAVLGLLGTCATPAAPGGSAPTGAAPGRDAPAPPSGAAPPAPASGGASPPAAAAPEARQVRVGMTTYSASYMDELVAVDKGYFREEGLDVEFLLAGGGVVIPALIAGEVQFTTSASSALTAILQGADLRVVFTSLDRAAYQLWSSTPDIKTLQDLIGKRVGISSRGDTHEIAMRLLLRKHGIDPNSVVYAPIGSGAARISAIETGAVDAATLAPRDFAQLSQPRGNLLADVEKELKLVYTGVATSGALLRGEPGLAERFLRAVAKGHEYDRRYRDATIDIIGRYSPVEPEVNEQDYDTNIRTFTDDGTMPDDALRGEVATRADLGNVSDPPPITDLFDYSVVKKVYADLKASGWQPTP